MVTKHDAPRRSPPLVLDARIDGDSKSLWTDGVELPARPSLDGDITVEVCIVGAGIAGLTTAYLLARERVSVVVLDDKALGGGQTGRTTAHLSAALDDGFHRLEQLHGREGARLAVESHAAAIDRIEAICLAESIHCDFRRVDEYLFTPVGSPSHELERERDAAMRAGLSVDLLVRAPLAFATGPTLRFANQAQFHPLKYMAGLVRAIIRDGGQIYCGTHADTIVGGEPARVQTTCGPIVTARAVVVATNAPVNDLAVIHTKQTANRSYVISASIPKGSVVEALYSDTLDPYHYVRVQAGADRDVLIVGGEDHKTGQERDPQLRWTRLEQWARERFVGMGNVEHMWSGQILEPVDGLAFIGRNPLDADNVYVATGDSGHGITHGTIAGILLTDLIQRRENSWRRLYDPSRRALRSLTDFVRGNLNVSAQYADWLGRGDSVEIVRGEGAVVRRGLSMIATYVDEHGKTHECSAACPHLGGVVRWNRAEKTWDCPCHGSRFDPLGRVIEGPAISDLARISEGE